MLPATPVGLRRGRDDGSVTAEAAVALPALVVLLLGAMWVLAALSVQARCVDTARLAARAAARGDSEADVRRRAAASLPAGATVTVTRTGTEVRVTVRAPAPSIVVGLTAPELAATATAAVEPEAEQPVPSGQAGGDQSPGPRPAHRQLGRGRRPPGRAPTGRRGEPQGGR
jgi:hypothetical protein